MRIHRSKALTEQWHTLPKEVRRFIEKLRLTPRLSSAMTIPERPNYYEEFITGYWIGWTVDDSSNETVIAVGIVEE